MLFYFTATGNCLYVARKLENQILSIPQELKKENLHYKDEKIGIVTPVYAGELPQIVRKFIEQAHFDTDYFYMILTYGKSDSVATIWSEAFCQKNHIHLDYAQSILMVDNYLPSFDMEEEILIDKKTDARYRHPQVSLKEIVKSNKQ